MLAKIYYDLTDWFTAEALKCFGDIAYKIKASEDVPLTERSRENHGIACICCVLVASDISLVLQQEWLQESDDQVHSQSPEAHLGFWVVCNRDRSPDLSTGLDIGVPIDNVDSILLAAIHFKEERAIPDGR